jgi:enoyl-CoA hydratase/carnithine racemase
MSKVLVEKANRIATVTINAPESRNTMTDAGMIEALLAALADVDADRGISVMILTGAGTAFSAGGDVKAMANRTGMFAGAPLDIAEGYRTGVQRIPKALYGLDIPTIAAVNGPAVGAGFNLALACDLRIAGESARFDARVLRLGLHPGGGHTWLLDRAVGPQTAAAMDLFGERVDGERAAALGLAWECVADEELVDPAVALAERAAVAPKELSGRVKATLRRAPWRASFEEALHGELEDQVWSFRQDWFSAPGGAASDAGR